MDENKKGYIKEYLSYFIVIIVVILIKIFIVTPIRVNGPSMNNTLKNNDIMILNEISYKFNGLNRFDIVVVRYNDEHLIKRVIGLPGDTIKYENDVLYVNGKKVKENFDHAETADVEEIKIPEGEYYVMGDNRVNSTDSRIIGTIKLKDIKGTTKYTIFPFKRFGNKN